MANANTDATAGDVELHGSYVYTDPLKGLYYGPGSLKDALPKLIKSLGVKKALVVTGRSLHAKTDVVRRVEQVLSYYSPPAHGATFWEIGEHAPITDINAGIGALTHSDADFIVSVGGGSPIDAAKAIIYRLHERDGRWLKHIAIPTTLSAAEYSIGAGYTNEQGEKVGVSAQELAPAGIILDAELTLATPERLWLSTGMRAVDHAVENLYRPGVPYPLKVLSYDALSMLHSLLPQSKSNPSDVPIRQRLQLASWMSLWPLKLDFYSPVGLSHSLGHRLGAKYGIPHGITSCLTLAPVVALQTRSASPVHKLALARALFYLRIKSTGNVEEDIELLAHAIEKLVEELDLKSSISEYRVPREDLKDIAEGALSGAIGKGRADERFEEVVKLLESLY